MKSKALSEKRRAKPGKRGAHRPLSKAHARNWQGPLRILGVTLVWVMSLAIALTATVYGYQKLDAPVAEITVTGDIEHLSRERVEQWVNEDLSGGFFSLDMASLCEALEARPWIAKVTARRQWPDRLLLHIEEEVPVAYWGEGQFLNQQGEILPEVRVSDAERLPRLIGPEGQQMALMSAYAHFAEALNAAGAGLRRLSLDTRGAWKMELSEGEELILGRDQLDARLDRFLVLWRQELMAKRGDLVRVDARYDKGLAVLWRSSYEGRAQATGAG